MVRAGRHGEREEISQQINAIVPGFDNVPDLTDLTDRKKISAAIKEKNPDYATPLLSNFTGQMNTFRNVIQPGDYILLPLKKDPSRILLGTVTGRYFHRSDDPDAEQRHALPVEWKDSVPREDLGADLLASINGALTVFEVSGTMQRNACRQSSTEIWTRAIRTTRAARSSRNSTSRSPRTGYPFSPSLPTPSAPSPPTVRRC